MARTYPKIRNFEMFRPHGLPGVFYVRMAGEGTVNLVDIKWNDDKPIFGPDGMIDPENGPYTVVLGIQKGQAGGMVVPVKGTIEEIADILNKEQYGS